MDGQDDLLTAEGLPQRIPGRIVEARKAEQHRIFREGQRMAAFGRNPSHLLSAQLRVPEDWQGHRDEATRVRAAPFVDVPIVVRAQDGERELLVLARGEQARTEAA